MRSPLCCVRGSCVGAPAGVRVGEEARPALRARIWRSTSATRLIPCRTGSPPLYCGLKRNTGLMPASEKLERRPPQFERGKTMPAGRNRDAAPTRTPDTEVPRFELALGRDSGTTRNTPTGVRPAAHATVGSKPRQAAAREAVAVVTGFPAWSGFEPQTLVFT